jgi:SAM-dependent methyltransferase
MSPLEAGLVDVIGVRPGERVLDAAASRFRGDLSRLPFDDGSFDVVVCRHGVKLLADRGTTLAEIHRVLVPGGRVGVSAWGRIERNPAFAALADALERRAGVQAAASVRYLFALEPEDLRALLTGAGFRSVRVRTVRNVACFTSIPDLVERYVPLALPDRQSIASDLERQLTPWLGSRGLTFPASLNVGVGRR